MSHGSNHGRCSPGKTVWNVPVCWAEGHPQRIEIRIVSTALPQSAVETAFTRPNKLRTEGLTLTEKQRRACGGSQPA